MLEELKQKVFEQNIRLKQSGLVILTWGNVSAIDEETKLVVIKPSGVDYDKMSAVDMVVVDLNGKIVEGTLNPSSDLDTHLEIYRNFPGVKGVVHTHSTFAVSFAQAGKDIMPLGTTHADTFYGPVPCTRKLSAEEVNNHYELNTGKVIVETFKDKDCLAIPAVLVKNHGPFTWGTSVEKAVDNAIILEEVAKMAYLSNTLNKDVQNIDQYLLDKHYLRKHGKNAYYGQKGNK